MAPSRWRGVQETTCADSEAQRGHDGRPSTQRLQLLKVEAGDLGGNRPFTLGVLATFAPTIPSINSELKALAEARGLRGADLVIEAQHVPDAMQALLEGDQERHDRLVAVAAAALPSSCSLVLLSQYSMACAEPAAAAAMAAAGLRALILTSPKSAVLKLARLLQQGGGTK